MKILRTIEGCICLMLLCSCATTQKESPKNSTSALSIDAPINKEAGQGDWLYLTLHLENGKELLFSVDTGTPVSILDKSLESKLGKSLGTKKLRYLWFGKTKMNSYSTPKLYFGNTQLLMGDRILTDDLSRMSSTHPLMGILGMDCLRHYCVQLDFAAEKMRLLATNDLKTDSFAKGFPLTISAGEVSTRAQVFLGRKMHGFPLTQVAHLTAH